MRDSSNKLIAGVIVACLLVIIGCLIFQPFGRSKREKTSPEERVPAVVKPSREAPPGESVQPTDVPPRREKGPEPGEIAEAAEDFDISGTVVDKAGNPLDGATVKLAFYSLKDFSFDDPSTVEEGKPLEYETKEDGRFGFKYQEGKRYVLSVDKEDYITENRNMSTPQKDMVIVLTLGGAIEGKVVDAVTHEPLEKFRLVTSQDTGGGLSLGFFTKKEVDIYLSTDGEEYNDPDGQFRVSGLQKGNYRLTSVAEGYAQSFKRGIEVELEKTTSGIIIEQQPAGKIHGRVIDVAAKPIEGATLVQKNPLHSAFFGELRLPQRKILASSDAQGEFEIDGLPAGTFTLQARHKDYCPAEQKVKVNKGETTGGVEFQLVQGGMISGVVIAKSDTQPIEGAKVKATRAPTFLIPNPGEADSETDKMGMFDLIKLEPGTYSVTVSAQDFADKEIKDLTLAENEAITDLIIELSQGGSLVGTVRDLAGKAAPNMVVFAVGPDGRKISQTDAQGNYAIRNLKEGTYAAGTVELSAAGGLGASSSSSYFVRIENDIETRLDMVVGGALRVYGQVTIKGQPQAGLIVSVESSTKSVMANKCSRSASDTTEENGGYEIENVQPGQYQLSVLKLVAMAPRVLFTTEIELADNDLEKNIELPEGGISGQVVDAETRKPIEGAKLALDRAKARDVREAFMVKLGFFVGGTETSDAEGKYSFSVLEDGEYFVVASKEGYASQGLTARVRNSRGPSDLDFSLSSGETLWGQVVGSDFSRPIKRIFLSARDSDGRVVFSKKIDLGEEGQYEAAGLTPGDYIVSVDAIGYASASKKTQIRAGADNRADFTLTAGGTLFLRLVDERGNPVTGAEVELMDEKGDYFLGLFPDLNELMNIGFEAITREDGVDVSHNLPEGTYRAKVSALGYEDEIITVTIREGEPAEETVTLRKSR